MDYFIKKEKELQEKLLGDVNGKFLSILEEAAVELSYQEYAAYGIEVPKIKYWNDPFFKLCDRFVADLISEVNKGVRDGNSYESSLYDAVLFHEHFISCIVPEALQRAKA